MPYPLEEFLKTQLWVELVEEIFHRPIRLLSQNQFQNLYLSKWLKKHNR